MDVTDFLSYTLAHGTEAEQQQAKSLKATVSLEHAKLQWSDLHKHTSPSGYEGRLLETTGHLSYTIEHGTETEKQAAYSLNASANLELARQNWSNFGKYSSHADRTSCLESVSEYLNKTIGSGTEPE